MLCSGRNHKTLGLIHPLVGDGLLLVGARVYRGNREETTDSRQVGSSLASNQTTRIWSGEVRFKAYL